MGSIINDFFDSDKFLIIIANDYSFDVINNIVSYVLNGNLKCILLKILEYGFRKGAVYKDLEVLSDAVIINNEKNISEKNLGGLKSTFITKDMLRVSFKDSDKISKYVLSINEELKEIDDDYTKEFYFKRLSMFNKGTALIEIGAYTKTELREKKMRLDDALCAVYSSNLGIVLGGGVTLLKIASQLDDGDRVARIWKRALEMPFLQLMINSGENYNKIKERLEKENFNLVYNVISGCFENKNETKIVDPYKIVNKTIINACSIASMLITTSSLIINENVNNLNKVTDYGDI